MARIRHRKRIGLNPDPDYELVLEEYRTRVRATVSFEAVLKRLGYTFRKTAHGNLVRCCLFHAEKSPSLRFVTRAGFFYCHGCKAAGDAVELVRRRLGSHGAFKFFRRHFGIEPPNNRKFYLDRLKARGVWLP